MQKLSQLHKPPILTPRTTLKHNPPRVPKLDQIAANSRVAMPCALSNLLSANTAGLLDFGEYPVRDVFGFTIFTCVNASQTSSTGFEPVKWTAEAENDIETRAASKSDFLTYRNHTDLYTDFLFHPSHIYHQSLHADVSPKTAQALARHSDIRLTMDVYTHVDRAEQISVIQSVQVQADGVVY